MSEIEKKQVIKGVEDIAESRYALIAQAVILLYRYMECIEERVEKLEKKEVM